MRGVLGKMWECGKYVKMRDFPHDCGMVDTYVHRKCPGIGESTVDDRCGVAIVWRASLDNHVTPLKLDINWLTGIRIQFENQVYVILCVYAIRMS